MSHSKGLSATPADTPLPSTPEAAGQTVARRVRPGLLKMAMNVLQTAMAVAKAGGSILVSPEVQQERFRICLDCPELWLPEGGRGGARCFACGCFIQLKTAIRAADCPRGKWPPQVPSTGVTP